MPAAEPAPQPSADKKLESTLVETGPACVGRYRLGRLLGSGSAGEVWKAEDPDIGRAVAVKLLRPPEGLPAAERAEWEQRFLREARAAGRLAHPGIVPVFDVGKTPEGRPFIVMELVEGRSLDAILKGGPPPGAAAVLRWGAEVAEALDAAHQRGVVHRDIKPANILIDQEGRARLADFGIARMAESEMTREGLFLGSPAYTSPEQLRGEPVDGRADLFSLGASIYAALTGRRPFKGDDISSLAYSICHAEPEPLGPQEAALPAGCGPFLAKALVKDPNGRFQSGREMAGALRGLGAGPSPDPLESHAGAVGSAAGVVVARATRWTIDGAGAAWRMGRAGAVKGSRRLRDLWARGWRRGPKARAAMVAGVVLALCAVTGGSIWVARWIEQRRQTPATRIKKAFTSLFSDASAPRQAPAPPRAAPPAEPAPMRPASLTIRATHGLREAQMQVWASDERVLDEKLSASGRAVQVAGRRLIEYRRSTAEFLARVEPGDHSLRVRIVSDDGGLRLEQRIQEVVSASASYTLEVRVRTWPSPRLDLEWIPRSGA